MPSICDSVYGSVLSGTATAGTVTPITTITPETPKYGICSLGAETGDYSDTAAPKADLSKIYGSARGDVTHERKEALRDAYLYLDELGFLEKIGYESLSPVYLDSNMNGNVLGETSCKIRGARGKCDIALKAGLYDESFLKKTENSMEQLMAKYHQVHTLAHEQYHKKFFEDPEGIKIIGNLEQMGYSEDVIRGFSEMDTEYNVINMIEELGAKDVAWVARRSSGYRPQLEAAWYINSTFDGGYDAFRKELASGNLDKETADKYLPHIGLETKAEYKAPCEKCAAFRYA